MDKNKLIGILFLVTAFLLMMKEGPQKKHEPTGTIPGTSTLTPTGGATMASSATQGTALAPPAPNSPPVSPVAPEPASPAQPEQTHVLTLPGEYTATFSNQGGTLKKIVYHNKDRRFRKFDPDRIQKILGKLNEAVTAKDEKGIAKWETRAKGENFPATWIATAKEPLEGGSFDAEKLFGEENNYILNENQKIPILGLSCRGFSQSLPFQVIEHTESSITYQAGVGDILITRQYTLEQGSFRINHSSTIHNRGTENFDPGAQIAYSLGSSLPTNSDKRQIFQNVGFYNGKRGWTGRRKPTIFKLQKMQKNGDKMEESSGNIFWATVRNQFFAVTLAPETPTSGIVRGRVYPLGSTDYMGNAQYGVTGEFALNSEIIAPGQHITHQLGLYAGPKEYNRLNEAGQHQDLVMQFGFFGLFSKLLLLLMQLLHGFTGNWGWAIITMTILIKLLFWPLTAKASESQKRMQKISAPMKELQEKYKDNPQKMQMEVSKLFRDNKVNPAAGCLPIFIQMPIFLGLFFMLQAAAELRFAKFFWISDLSEPERLLHWGMNIPILGEYLNVLPIFMGITMFIQMSLTPIPQGADEMQQMQAKMFKFLPFVFLFMLYGFSSGLVLYWTVQNVLSILQQKLVNARKDDTPIVLPSPSKKKKKA